MNDHPTDMRSARRDGRQHACRTITQRQVPAASAANVENAQR
ncbi:hypothetical protein [Nocardia gipuzkoensis]|nr:hypothetical protein [Nocardia gipuzkoensis]